MKTRESKDSRAHHNKAKAEEEMVSIFKVHIIKQYLLLIRSSPFFLTATFHLAKWLAN